MRFARHETFHFREGWLTKGLRKIGEEEVKDVFLSKEAMEELGIGSNMVKSLRYWMLASGLTTENNSGKKQQELTDFGRVINNNDRYLEEELTLWLLHYYLATNEKEATTWYWFYNIFEPKEFDKESFVFELESFVKGAGEEIAKGSLEKDFDCLLSMYISNNDLNIMNPENNLGCPLQDLGVIEIVDVKEKRFRKTRRNILEMPKEIFLFGILDFLGITNRGKEVSIDALLTEPKSISKIFNLSIGELIQVLELLQIDGYLRLSKTAGLNHVSILTDDQPLEVITKYYESRLGV